MSGSQRQASAGELRREAAAMMQAAMRKLAEADRLEGGERQSSECYEIVDFDSLPGRSPHLRAEALLMGRRIRDRLFPAGIFGEPAWDLLLELFLAQHDPHGVPMASALRMTTTPDRTAERWIDLLAERGLLERARASAEHSDDTVRLSSEGLERLSRFFAFTEGQAPARGHQAARWRSASSSPDEG